ncbi:conserved hypothetical protein [Alkaliphilus metalliredigens QYMF]|uniref:DUF2922 domain-containing protein n=1 Tax=Alkaliphilus metalliredigens (strain QYMF) TaxID=293826 RepID=A6TQ27_ALKMQ|nr:conserved hypothetical protein [Alkaliphilus metalliredigens QYMF]
MSYLNKYLRMVFKTDDDRSVSLRVSVPRDDLDAAQVKAVMDLIVAKDVIFSTVGNLVAVDSAYIVQTETTELDVSA